MFKIMLNPLLKMVKMSWVRINNEKLKEFKVSIP